MSCVNLLNQKVIIVAHNQEHGRAWAKLKLLNPQRIPAIIYTPAGLAGIRGHLVIYLCGIADCPRWRADLLNNVVIQDV